MSWKLKNIPKTLFLYWGKNRPLSYLRYLTVKSFSIYNPDWAIRVYYSKSPVFKHTWTTQEQKYSDYEERDYFNELCKIPGVSVLPADILSEMGHDGKSEVFKSDILRLYLMSEIGGWWSDFDILYIKPMDSMVINSEENENARCCICYCGGFNSIGFLGGGVGCEFYKHLLSMIPHEIDENNYQSIGRFLFDKNIGIINKAVVNMPSSIVYPVAWNKCGELFSCDVDDSISCDTIGIHWFAGVKNVLVSGSTIDKYIRTIEGA